MSLPQSSVSSSGVEAESPASAKRRAYLRRRGPLRWHLRKPQRGSVSVAVKNHFVAMVGEYVGTVLFLLFALGGANVAFTPATNITGPDTVNTSSLLYRALSFGFSLAVNAWIFFRVSGGLFNPAVSLGMVLVGALTPLRGALLAFSQILGGITGAAILQAITPGMLNARTTLGGGTSVAQGLFIEMFLTSLLMLSILLLAAEKHKATFIAPVGIGLALFVAELLGLYYTGGSVNPARSFGPSVVLLQFSSYDWIYWLGPALGATIAAGFYKTLKWLQYETVLGPEVDGSHPPTVTPTTTPMPLPGSEKAGGTTGTTHGTTMAVTGPGLNDLLTEGPREAVFDLERRPGPLEERLDRIEVMLAKLIPQHAGAGEREVNGGSRLSNLTAVETRTSPKAHTAEMV